MIHRDLEHQRAFILAHTAPAAPPAVPEISLLLASEFTQLWQVTERWLEENGVEPPFWAFAWAGGQALARTLLDRPELVRGRRVLDFACGAGIAAIAAARAGAASVTAVDRDALAVLAASLNAERNGVHIEARCADPCAEETQPTWVSEADIVLAGDVCYDRAMAGPVLAWLRARAAAGARVLLGDPGRAYLPGEGVEEIARVRVPTPDGVEAVAEMSAAVYFLLQ